MSKGFESVLILIVFAALAESFWLVPSPLAIVSALICWGCALVAGGEDPECAVGQW